MDIGMTQARELKYESGCLVNYYYDTAACGAAPHALGLEKEAI